MEFRQRKEKELERLKEQNKKQKENNRLAVMMKAEERRRQMEEDIRNFKEQKKNNPQAISEGIKESDKKFQKMIIQKKQEIMRKNKELRHINSRD